MAARGVDISIVIPVRDEAENILALASEIALVMEKQTLAWECVWVDDGSTDGSLSLLRDLARADRRHRYVSFEGNRGQSAALLAGFEEAAGRLIATIDGDGQNDPADIPPLARIVESGAADMANGYRARRRDNLARRLSSAIANGFRNWTTGRSVRDVGCSTRVFKRECVRSFPRFSGMHRFLPTLAALAGFRLAEIPVNHRPRKKGRSKYSINNRLWVGLFDTFGVFWLRQRGIRYTIGSKSDCDKDPS